MKLIFNRQSFTLLVLMFCCLLLAGVTTYWYRENKQQKQQDMFEQHLTTNAADRAAFLDRAGNVITFPRTRADITVVTLWASWSPFSANDFSVLQEVLDKYTESQVSVVLLNRMETVASAERYLIQFPPPDRAAVIIDEKDTYYQNIAGYTMPETIIYNRSGDVLFHVRGPLDLNNLITFLEESL